MSKEIDQKYYISKVNSLSSNLLHYRNPYIIIWWSLAFPGFGHFMTNSYLWGFIFISFEYMINTFSNLNTSIYYTMIGNFEMAKDVINHRWFLLYIPIYVFAVWDSFRRAISLNKIVDLVYSETTGINPFHFSSVEINVLGKKIPWVAIVWGFLVPSMGYIYVHRLWNFLFAAIWWIIVMYQSHLLEGVFFTAIGSFSKAKEILDLQWFLYLPSIYTFAIYYTYTLAVENNKLYKIYQSRLLKKEYQRASLDGLFK